MKNPSEVVGSAEAPSTSVSENQSIVLEDGLSIGEDSRVEHVFGAAALVYAAGNGYLEIVDTFIENARSPDDPIAIENTELARAADKAQVAVEHALPAAPGLSALSDSAMQAAVQKASADIDVDMDNRAETDVIISALESTDFSALTVWMDDQGKGSIESHADRLDSVFLQETLHLETMLEPWDDVEFMDVAENNAVTEVEDQGDYLDADILLVADKEGDVD